METEEGMDAELEEIIADEERKMRESENKEKRFLEVFKDEPLEALSRPSTVSPVEASRILRGEDVDAILRAAGLTAEEQRSSRDIGKAKRSKRYYIRKRIEAGKPYIPARIRSLGKKRAKEMGYDVWERRNPEGLEEEEEAVRLLEGRDRVQKLSSIFRMLGSRIPTYFKREENKND